MKFKIWKRPIPVSEIERIENKPTGMFDTEGKEILVGDILVNEE